MININLKKLKKPLKIKQKIFFDKRGYFQELCLKKKFKLNIRFTAIASSKKNVIRGLHFQLKDKQTKLIYVVEGKILPKLVSVLELFSSYNQIFYVFSIL